MEILCNSLPQAETEKVKRKIREVAKEDVEDKLLEACGYLGSYSDACRATVIDNFDAIYRCVQNPSLIAKTTPIMNKELSSIRE